MFGKKTVRKGRARKRYVVTINGRSQVVSSPDKLTTLTSAAKARGDQVTWREA